MSMKHQNNIIDVVLFFFIFNIEHILHHLLVFLCWKVGQFLFQKWGRGPKKGSYANVIIEWHL